MKKLTKWSLDQTHCEISFKVRHLMISQIKGSFVIFDASIYTSERDFTTADIDLWIDASSITTGDVSRDEHLKGPDFFDVENHKQITFTSNTIGQQGENNQQELWGKLTIKGITKNIKLIAEFGGMIHDPLGNEKAGYSVSGTIKRSDFGIIWNTTLDSGGLLVSDEILISCEIELINVGEKSIIMELVSENEEVKN